MKAALALIFFACVAGSMAADARGELLGQLVSQGQTVVQGILAQVQTQIFGLVQQALGQLTSLVGSIGGRFDINFNAILDQFKPLLTNALNQVLGGVLGSLAGVLGGMYYFSFQYIFQYLLLLYIIGRAGINLSEIFSNFLQQITTPILGIGQHLANQGLAAVLGGLGGSRGLGDIFACK